MVILQEIECVKYSNLYDSTNIAHFEFKSIMIWDYFNGCALPLLKGIKCL